MSLTGKPDLTSTPAFTNDGFWPDLDVAGFLSKYRIPSEYADDTVSWGITLALVNVNLELEPVKLAVVTLGYSSLAAYCAVYPDVVNGVDALVVQYLQAVYARAKAFLLQQFNSMNRRKDAEEAAKEAPQTEIWWLDQSAMAVQVLFSHFLHKEVHTANHGVHVGSL